MRVSRTDLREARGEIPRSIRLCQESKIKRFEFIKVNRNKYRVAKLCEVLCVSRSSYYAWDKRPESIRAKENKILLQKIKDIHNKSNKVYGSIKIGKSLNNGKTSYQPQTHRAYNALEWHKVKGHKEV